jgi:hypothetical protein
MYPMELQGDRTEVTIRLLSNGRYVWTITTNAPIEYLTYDKDKTDQILHLKQLDGELRDAFPNHVKENSVKFSEFKDE